MRYKTMIMTFKERDKHNFSTYTIRFINSGSMYGVFYKGRCKASLFKTREQAQAWLDLRDNQ